MDGIWLKSRPRLQFHYISTHVALILKCMISKCTKRRTNLLSHDVGYQKHKSWCSSASDAATKWESTWFWLFFHTYFISRKLAFRNLLFLWLVLLAESFTRQSESSPRWTVSSHSGQVALSRRHAPMLTVSCALEVQQSLEWPSVSQRLHTARGGWKWASIVDGLSG